LKPISSDLAAPPTIDRTDFLVRPFPQLALVPKLFDFAEAIPISTLAPIFPVPLFQRCCALLI